jgi:hypothetical protein
MKLENLNIIKLKNLKVIILNLVLKFIFKKDKNESRNTGNI